MRNVDVIRPLLAAAFAAIVVAPAPAIAAFTAPPRDLGLMSPTGYVCKPIDKPTPMLTPPTRCIPKPIDQTTPKLMAFTDY